MPWADPDVADRADAEAAKVDPRDRRRAHEGDVGELARRPDGDAARIGAEPQALDHAPGANAGDAEIVGAPVRNEDVAVVGRHREKLRHGADPNGPVDAQPGDVDPVDEARAVARRGRAHVAARRPETGTVHRVVRDVGIAAVRRERRLDGSAPHGPPVLRIAEPVESDGVLNRLDQPEAPVVDRDRVPVHHVLGEEEPGLRRDHGLRRDPSRDLPEPLQAQRRRRRPGRLSRRARRRRSRRLGVHGGQLHAPRLRPGRASARRPLRAREADQNCDRDCRHAPHATVLRRRGRTPLVASPG